MKQTIDPTQRTNSAWTISTYHRVGCLLACACFYVGFIRSKPGVRAMKIYLSRPRGATDICSPSRVNLKVVCEWRSLLEPATKCCNHLQLVGGLPTPTEAMYIVLTSFSAGELITSKILRPLITFTRSRSRLRML